MKTLHKLRLRTLRLAALSFTLTVVSPLAHAANNVGWVLVDQANFTGGYYADAAHSFNSAHGAVTVQTGGNGTYLVGFQNLAISATTP